MEKYISSTEWKNYIAKDSFQKLSSKEQDSELHKKFYADCIAKEKEKLYFFLLANSNHAPVVIVRSPSSDAELKKFLGYTWKDSKEDAGLKIVGQRGTQNNIDKIQTPMFNPADLNDESKNNILIRNNFLNKELKKLPHTTVCGLTDILDFNLVDFNKEIDLSLLNRIQIESKYGTKKFDKILQLEYGKNLPEEERKAGNYPVMGSNGRVGMHNAYLAEGPVIIVGRKGSAGQTVWEEENCNPIDTTFYVKPVDDTYTLKFAYYLLVAIDLRKIPKQKKALAFQG